MTEDEEFKIKIRLNRVSYIREEIAYLKKVSDMVLSAGISIPPDDSCDEYSKAFYEMSRYEGIRKAIRRAIREIIDNLEKQYAEI